MGWVIAASSVTATRSGHRRAAEMLPNGKEALTSVRWPVQVRQGIADHTGLRVIPEALEQAQRLDKPVASLRPVSAALERHAEQVQRRCLAVPVADHAPYDERFAQTCDGVLHLTETQEGIAKVG